MEIPNSLEKLELVMPLKHDTKKTPFYMSSNNLFLKDGLKDNHWVEHSVMKLVDAVICKERKALREGNNDKSENFYIEILDEGALYKAL